MYGSLLQHMHVRAETDNKIMAASCTVTHQAFGIVQELNSQQYNLSIAKKIFTDTANTRVSFLDVLVGSSTQQSPSFALKHVHLVVHLK